MSEIVRISDAASIGMHAMMLLAAKSHGEPLSAVSVAETLGVSKAHLAKVFQRLAKAHLVKSTRGPQGGFVLGRSADTIPIMEIYEVLEGPFGETGCLLGEPVCDGDCCLLGGKIAELHDELKRYLERTRLSELCTKIRL